MLFVIYGIDRPGKLETRLAVRPKNIEYLAASEDKMLVAGPLLKDDGSMAGSLLIMEFPDRAAAEKWVEQSVLTKNDVYERVEIWPFTKKWPRQL
jgi:uncharacterized protein YciI